MSSSKIQEKLLQILVCPETKQPVTLASEQILDDLNARIRSGSVRNRGGDVVSTPAAAGLVRQDGRVLYRIDSGIPVMLIEESIELA